MRNVRLLRKSGEVMMAMSMVPLPQVLVRTDEEVYLFSTISEDDTPLYAEVDSGMMYVIRREEGRDDVHI